MSRSVRMCLCATLSGVAGHSLGACPASSNTACGAGATCCAMQYSESGYGCCHLENAICCDNSSTIMPTGDAIQNCCPADYTCKQTSKYSAQCIPPAVGEDLPGLQVCTPGPRYRPDDKVQNPDGLPAVIVIGDSVSIGYTPHVVEKLKGVAFVQHSPWASGGGAADTKNGLNCIEEFLRTSSFEAVQWDLVWFNFGLHNLGNTSEAFEEYREELTNITVRINASGAKVLYALTTPMMADYNAGNKAVEQDNEIAAKIMQELKIPTIDLYSTVTGHCGSTYVDCDICAVSPCTHHYTAAGYDLIADAVADGIKEALGSPAGLFA